MPQMNSNYWNGAGPSYVPTAWTPQGPTWQQYPSYSRYVPKPPQVLTGNHVPEVDGINGANAFPMGANSAVLLLDKKDPYVYLKTTDDAGYPNVERYRVTPDPIEEVSQEEVAGLRAEITQLQKTIAELKEAQNAQSDIRQPAIQATAQPVQAGQPDGIRPQGGYDWGYQAPVRPDAGQPQP